MKRTTVVATLFLVFAILLVGCKTPKEPVIQKNLDLSNFFESKEEKVETEQIEPETVASITAASYEELLEKIDSLDFPSMKVFTWNESTGEVKFFDDGSNINVTSENELVFIYHQAGVKRLETSTDEYFFVDSDSKKASMVGIGRCNFSNMEFKVTSTLENDISSTITVYITVAVPGFEKFDPAYVI